MKTSTILVIVAILGMGISGCGETAKEVQALTRYECPMTDEYDHWVNVTHMKDVVDDIVNEEQSVHDQTVDVTWYEDDSVSIDVVDGHGCLITHHIVVGTN